MGADLQGDVREVAHHIVVETQVAAHNHGVHEVVVDPDEEEPGGVGHLLVERRPDLREEQVGLEAGLLPSVQVVGL